MKKYKQPFISYLSYMFVTQITLKWVVFTIHFCSGEGGKEGRGGSRGGALGAEAPSLQINDIHK